MMPDQFLLGNCLDLMRSLPDASVDMVLCDLPYEQLNRSNPNAAWDRMLPFDQLWEQYLRVCKENAAIVLFGNGMFTARLMMSKPELWRYNLIWEKDRCTGFLNANRMPMRNHEDILVFYRQQPVYHPQMTLSAAPNHPRGNGPHKHTNNCYGNHHEVADPTDLSYLTNKPNKTNKTNTPSHSTPKVGSTYDYAHINRVPPTSDPNLRFPRSVLQFPKEHGRKAWHPTQKPNALLRWLIRTYTDENDVILDNCAGSGSSLIAAMQEHRHYIGMEMNEKYYRRALADINAARRDLETQDVQLTLDLD